MKKLIIGLVALSVSLAATFVYGEGNDEYTVLLLHANGLDGSTSFVDDSVAGNHTVTAYGDAQIDTAQSKFAGASALFDGDGDYLSIPDSENWNFGTGNFTIDLWVRFNSLFVAHSWQMFVCQEVSANDFWCFAMYNEGNNPKLKFESVNVPETLWLAKDITLSVGVWYHFAIVRDGNSFKMFQNGVQLGSVDFSSQNMPNLDAPLTISSAYFDGWIDELRISKGIARWTSNFTPPIYEYDDVINEVPIADAGTDVQANVGQEVILNGSYSYDPDGEIVSWVWRSLSDPENPIMAEGETTTINAHGYAEEMIELTVTDNRGATATDTMIITNPGTEGPPGPQGPPGITPEEISAMQNQITILEQQNVQQQQIINENRYLLEQLPQLRHALEELRSQTR